MCIAASAVVALHFEDEFYPFEPLEARLAAGEEAYTAPNFFQEVMEALRRPFVRAAPPKPMPTPG